jgi:23S rRNA pseudouridine2604 synthase
MFIDRMAQGLVILDRPTKPCRIDRLGLARFRIILTEGRNRQIRRMCQMLGYRVLTLHRIRIMHVTLDELIPGQWKPLTGEERTRLFQAIGRGSSQIERLAW